MVDCGRTAGHRKRRYASFTKSATQKKIRLAYDDPAAGSCEMLHSAVGPSKGDYRRRTAFLNESHDRLLAALDDDRDRLMRARANLRIACAYAGKVSQASCKLLTTETGASAIFESSALERAGRRYQRRGQTRRHEFLRATSSLAGLHLGLDQVPS